MHACVRIQVQVVVKACTLACIYACVPNINKYIVVKACTLACIYTCIFMYNVNAVTGLEIEVAMVANATMFSHLLPGCSCGRKHLLLP